MRRFILTQRRALLVLLIVALSSSVMLACGFSTALQGFGPRSVSAQIKAAQGGRLTLNGATLTIPPNALFAGATVTLTDTGQPKHAKGDPLNYVSDAFSVDTKGADGKPVLFTSPATLRT